MRPSRSAFPTGHTNAGMNLVEYYAGQFLAGEATRGLSSVGIAGVVQRAFDYGEAMAAESQKRRERES